MAHIHRTGPVDPVFLDVAVTSNVPTNAIEQGDLIAQVTGKAVPAPAFPWTTDEATTRAAFVAAFVGVSDWRSRQATTDPRDLIVSVGADGTFEFDAVNATYTINQLIGPAKAAGNALLNTVKVVTPRTEAVAVVVKTTTGTRVLGRLLNTTIKK